MDGNQRFVTDTRSTDTDTGDSRRSALVAGQQPFAAILGCSDSRAPAELLFDQGLGDLFVIRVAGNIAAPSQVGSVEFSAAVLGCRLVVVMGHSRCGAVEATLADIQTPGDHSPNLQSIVDNIRPHIQPAVDAHDANGGESLSQQAVRANVRGAVNQLREGSAVLENLIKNDGLVVVGAEYSLETGIVDFFELPAGIG